MTFGFYLMGPRARGREILRQLPSHSSLLRSTSGRPERREVDAIVVPASRPVQHLEAAIKLAHSADVDLVLLCSKETRVEEVRARLAKKPSVRATVVDIPERFALPGLRLETSEDEEFTRASFNRASDLSVKRNIGLLLGRMLGWGCVVFLDDDVHRVSVGDLSSLAGALTQGDAASMTTLKYPDNSVVCHARRAGGFRQGIFVSGAVLAVDCRDPELSFFPDIYNEDWFFLHGALTRRGVVRTGFSRQRRYDPFADPERARREEFGDVLAEGLMAGLHERNLGDLGTMETWDAFLPSRLGLIQESRKALEQRGRAQDQRILTSLQAAEEQLTGIDPYLYPRFVEAWQGDLRTWSGYLQGTGQFRQIAPALEHLGLPTA